MKIHYFPDYACADDLEQAPCGTWFSDCSEISGDWGKVTCKKCIAKIGCACILCKNRPSCMPGYDDNTLVEGVVEGGLPRTRKECRYHKDGDSETRIRALNEKDEFDNYAKNLIESFNK